MKYRDNINQVATLQPDYLGFIFYEKSVRFFDGNIPEIPKTIKKMGVFVNASLEFVLEKIAKYNLHAIQLHGNESPEFCDDLKRRYKECQFERVISSAVERRERNNKEIEIIKVFSVKDEFNFDILKPYESVCDYYLFDTKGKLPGGNGYTFNWKVLKKYPSTKPYFLSGGIGLEEVESVLSFLRRQESRYCYAIDVNSKFESKPGLKDINRLKEFKKNGHSEWNEES